MNKLLQRIITAAVLIVVLVVVFFRLPPTAAIAMVAAFVLIAAWEWSGFLWVRGELWPRLGYVATVAGLMALALRVFPAEWPVEWILAAATLWWCVAFYCVMRFPVNFRQPASALCGLLVLIPPWTVLAEVLWSAAMGPAYVLLVLTIIWAADVGAYFVGRRIGRTKLAPAVSPGKTWEGALGGLAAAGIAAAVGARILQLPAGLLVPVAIAAAAVSIVGDLTVSMFKRSAGLKDSGQLFPGHGGVLDRIDSVTAAVPLFFLGGGWLGLFDL